MTKKYSSRDRMLAALACERSDYTPCCFMLYKALENQCRDQREFCEQQIALGLDTVAAIPIRPTRRPFPMPELGNLRGLPVSFAPEVNTKSWREDVPGKPFAVLHREYDTPAGRLCTAIDTSEDFKHSDRIAIFDDYVVPRALRRLVGAEEHLDALRYLLRAPSNEEIEVFRGSIRGTKEFAAKHDLLVVGEWGVLFDAACWLCGMQEVVYAMIENPSFIHELFQIIGDWNRARMQVILDAGVDLFIRRAWYETADFLSPALHREFILPQVRRDAECVHSAGARLGNITTSSYMPFLDTLIEAGVDCLIGLDPLQDRLADFAALRARTAGKMCLWGGVNGCVTVEMGTADDVRAEVAHAMETLAPGGGFILSPVDNVIACNTTAAANVKALITAWEQIRSNY